MLLPLTGQQYSEKVTDNCIAAWKAADVYTGEEAAIIKLLEIFKPKSFPPVTSTVFSHSPSGTLTIGFLELGGVPAAESGVIENKKLTNAVLESIIGEKGVSSAAKQSLAKRISEFLNKKEEKEEEEEEEEEKEEILVLEKGKWSKLRLLDCSLIGSMEFAASPPVKKVRIETGDVTIAVDELVVAPNDYLLIVNPLAGHTGVTIITDGYNDPMILGKLR
ncbi:Chalcone--flavonone isomerase [Dendrobium catenatum]|uniref:Chalcone-flavonone isomerase family protein n=1 Tax=Dendrobium catenatum TaxID=906689 RepID=A0A2I0VGH3_9ASPA|nr:Chalcone--flavonone isomerase [Dendrobium catenatum]